MPAQQHEYPVRPKRQFSEGAVLLFLIAILLSSGFGFADYNMLMYCYFKAPDGTGGMHRAG